MTNYAFIFARGGSKGLPGKNILSIAGKPMLAHAVELALESAHIDRVFVSTDDLGISKVARDSGAEVPFMRPAELASDTSSEWLAWQHAVGFVSEEISPFDTFISLPVTAPCRTLTDIESACKLLTSDVDMVVTATESNHNPHFNMLKKSADGFEKFSSEEKVVTRRQDVPKAYNMSTVAYVSRPEFILKNTSMWDGKIQAHIVDPLNAIDIDDEHDFKMAELILNDRLNKS